jgi:hypothetical protein
MSFKILMDHSIHDIELQVLPEHDRDLIATLTIDEKINDHTA